MREMEDKPDLGVMMYDGVGDAGLAVMTKVGRVVVGR